jgi:hypothetical protein
VREWERAAYAGRTPALERVRELCASWTLHFRQREDA